MPNQSQKTIAYVTTYDASDVRFWSGTGYYMGRALESAGGPLSYVGPLDHPRPWLGTLKEALYPRVSGSRYLVERSRAAGRGYARQVARRLPAGTGVVFSPGTIPISYLSCPQPIVFWTDSTFGAMVEFYPAYSGLCPESLRDGNAMERAALDRCSLAIYSSDWAAASALALYGAAPDKVKVVPFGANLSAGWDAAEIDGFVRARGADTCHLLFIASDWERKGGSIAVEIAGELNASGIPTVLTILGSGPETGAGPMPGFVRPLGFVDKSTPEGRATIKSALETTHFLILPSRADCTPIAVAEANSAGVPCLASDVGGLPTLVRDDVNGRLFEPDAPASAYCAYVAAMLEPARYGELARSSFEEYRRRLNWRTSAGTVLSLMRNLL